jgi:hypothetical protein
MSFPQPAGQPRCGAGQEYQTTRPGEVFINLPDALHPALATRKWRKHYRFSISPAIQKGKRCLKWNWHIPVSLLLT